MKFSHVNCFLIHPDCRILLVTRSISSDAITDRKVKLDLLTESIVLQKGHELFYGCVCLVELLHSSQQHLLIGLSYGLALMASERV